MEKIELIFKVIVIFIFFSLLYSCMIFEKQDGPPPFYVDEKKIPNAIPKPEKLAKYGNMPSYLVMGKRYYVMPKSSGYQAIGKASWYGTKFHGIRTSSGEPYNLLSMTAAHKTLPLPTYLEVTNLVNHRKVIVKVNDRGPFEGNRLIDLSYVAAKKLDMLGQGTTMVHIKAIDPYFREKINITAFNKNAFYLQVGAFKSKHNAEKLKANLRNDISMQIDILMPTEDEDFYRVRIGPIIDDKIAKDISKRLMHLGLKPGKIISAV